MFIKMKVHAVITGDISRFTTLNPAQREQLVSRTEALLTGMVARKRDARMFRGDSYQLVTADVGRVLWQCVKLVCWFKLSGKRAAETGSTAPQRKSLGTRISVGIGEVAYQGKTVLDADGEAFHLSGRVFDAMDKTEAIYLTTSNAEKNAAYQIILMYINLLMRQWTATQAETIFELLSRPDATQEQVARALKTSQPAVAKSLQAARWKEVEKGIMYLNQQLNQQYAL